MYGENGGRLYDGAVRVPDEIRNVRDPIMFGMTGRELLFGVAGLAVALLASIVVFGLLHLRGRVFLVIPVIFAGPFFLFGFVRPSGLFFEDFLVIWCSNNLKSAPVRKLSAVNAYERAQIIGVEKRKEEEEKKEGKKDKKKSPKEKKPKSAYTVRQ